MKGLYAIVDFFPPSKASIWLGLSKAVKFMNSLFLEPKRLRRGELFHAKQNRKRKQCPTPPFWRGAQKAVLFPVPHEAGETQDRAALEGAV